MNLNTNYINVQCTRSWVRPHWVDAGRDAAQGGYQYDTGNIEKCPPSKKVRLPDDEFFYGVGKWETVSSLESSLSKESDDVVIESLNSSYLQIILKLCPPDKISSYKQKVGELFFNCFDGFHYRCGFEVEDYADFCRRGKIELDEPLYTVLSSNEGEQYSTKIKEMYERLIENMYIYRFNGEESQFFILARMLTYALDRVNQQWSDTLLTEIYKAGRPDIWVLLGDDNFKQKMLERFEESSDSVLELKPENNAKACWQFWKKSNQ